VLEEGALHVRESAGRPAVKLTCKSDANRVNQNYIASTPESELSIADLAVTDHCSLPWCKTGVNQVRNRCKSVNDNHASPIQSSITDTAVAEALMRPRRLTHHGCSRRRHSHHSSLIRTVSVCDTVTLIPYHTMTESYGHTDTVITYLVITDII
jgi:hypothetical protein